MNWMIDGAYGDLYRQTMGYPQLEAAKDEWQIKRNLHRKPGACRNLLAPAMVWAAAALNKLRGTLPNAPARTPRPVTQWTLF